MAALPRRSSRSHSFSLNVEPEPLFHDEEIALSGVNIQNPLWDSGSSLSWGRGDDNDLLLPPTNLFALTRTMLPRRSQPPPPRQPSPYHHQHTTKSSIRSCVEFIAKAMAAIAIICAVVGIVALSFTQGSEIWASSGLIGENDDDAMVIADPNNKAATTTIRTFDCSRTFVVEDAATTSAGASFTRYIESVSETQNSTLCEKEFVSDCRCLSTLGPVLPEGKIIGDTEFPTTEEDLDVVFLGDTLIENCARGLLREGSLSSDLDNNSDRNGMAAICHQLFRKESGGSVNGLAFGASGDRIGHLLYRLQEDGTILDKLNPKVWWIQIGSNDVGKDHCSSESIAWATQPLIETIKSRRPGAQIVVNSIILPPQEAWNSSNSSTRQNLNKTNDLLQCFAQQDANDVQFYDASHIFSSEDDISLDGMREWGEAIVKKVMEMTT